MCEYCGCQQIATIAELTREHDAVVNLVGQIHRALQGQRHEAVATSCRQILTILAPHTVVEEEGLFPEMTGEFPDHIEVLRSEHREVEKVLGEAAEGFPDDPTWPDRLVGVLVLLREHILKEQDGVFPAALVALDPDQWERIEAVRAKLPKSLATGQGEPSGR
jgi:hemerythrin-like domain-containing protein